MSNANQETLNVHRLRVISRETLDAAYSAARDHGMKLTASVLDDMFGAEGRPVSESLLRAGLKNVERNYARLEWVSVLALLPGSEILPILASAAGYELHKKRVLTDAEWRARVEHELPRVLGQAGQEFLSRLGR